MASRPLRQAASFSDSSKAPPSSSADSTPFRRKFGTIGGSTPPPGAGARRKPRRGAPNLLASMLVSPSKNGGSQQHHRRDDAEEDSDPELERILKGLKDRQDDPWCISVAPEAPPTETTGARGKKPAKRSAAEKVKDEHRLTLYVTTPTSSLTLSRSFQAIAALDASLRKTLPDQMRAVPALEPLAVSPIVPAAKKAKKPSTRSSSSTRQNLSASLANLLSPRRSTLPRTPPATAGQLPSEWQGQSDAEGPSRTPSAGSAQQLSKHLTTLSSDPAIRASEAWKRFFEPSGDEDLSSNRLERRVKRMKSLPGQSVPSTVVPPLPVRQTVDESEDEVSSLRRIGANAQSDEANELSKEDEEVFRQHMALCDAIELQDSLPASAEVSKPSQPAAIAPSSPLAPIVQGHGPPSVDVVEHAQERSIGQNSASTVDSTDHAASLSDGLRRRHADRSVGDTSTEATTTEDYSHTNSHGEKTMDFGNTTTDTSLSASVELDGESSVMELPSRPRTADPQQQQGERSSRIVKVPSSGADPMDVSTPVKSKKGKSKRQPKVGTEDFEFLHVLGKGCAGKVFMVRKRVTGSLYAMKAIHKHHVLAHREVAHTKTEQDVLRRCANDFAPFIVRLHWSFHNSQTLFLVLDFHPGGDLATQLARYGRFNRDRTRFYAAEIADGLGFLHNEGVIYRDLKPENCLISAEGHIVLTDFGLSKAFSRPSAKSSSDLLPSWMQEDETSSTAPTPRSPKRTSSFFTGKETTTSFVGTAEYLAVEVLIGEPYSYQADAWSLGTMIYEMLAGVTPFWAESHSEMYKRVLNDELLFEPPQAFDEDSRSFLRGLLAKDPVYRMNDKRIKAHAYFSMISWDHIRNKRYLPPYIPQLDPTDPADTSQFDDLFLSMDVSLADEKKPAVDESGSPQLQERDPPEGEPAPAFDEQGRDVFDGYSFFGGREDGESIHSVESEPACEAPSEPAAPSPVDPPQTGASTARPLSYGTIMNVQPPSNLPAEEVEEDSTASTDLAPPRILYEPTDLVAPSLTRESSLLSMDAAIPEEEDVSGAISYEDDDSDWSVLEHDGGQIAVNGRLHEPTLFGRKVKDRYKLLLVASSPLRPSSARSSSFRSASGRRARQVSQGSKSSDSPGPSSSSGGGVRGLLNVSLSPSSTSLTGKFKRQQTGTSPTPTPSPSPSTGRRKRNTAERSSPGAGHGSIKRLGVNNPFSKPGRSP